MDGVKARRVAYRQKPCTPRMTYFFHPSRCSYQTNDVVADIASILGSKIHGSNHRTTEKTRKVFLVYMQKFSRDSQSLDLD